MAKKSKKEMLAEKMSGGDSTMSKSTNKSNRAMAGYLGKSDSDESKKEQYDNAGMIRKTKQKPSENS